MRNTIHDNKVKKNTKSVYICARFSADKNRKHRAAEDGKRLFVDGTREMVITIVRGPSTKKNNLVITTAHTLCFN